MEAHGSPEKVHRTVHHGSRVGLLDGRGSWSKKSHQDTAKDLDTGKLHSAFFVRSGEGVDNELLLSDSQEKKSKMGKKKANL